MGSILCEVTRKKVNPNITVVIPHSKFVPETYYFVIFLGFLLPFLVNCYDRSLPRSL